MKFKYKKYSPYVIRPVIPIEVAYKSQSIQQEVLVDSGADNCIFDAEVGETLGIDVKKGKMSQAAGITGKPAPIYKHTIKINVGGYDYNIEAGFKYDYYWPYSIVGQIGFFSLFIVKFDFKKEEVEIIPRMNIN